ncbi:hypothetical protein HFN63_00285 [Rhizobium leguminosarum]|uniref:hypothetical protein n=1 Tax=Rhizobium leguminosarum TaxID=384 RepID=UPI001C950C6D|nr:hypothetical protein [Rhizobium leguminosarum]MBY5768570.1 hypothetical protein [Rhizobium leguminosarum]
MGQTAEQDLQARLQAIRTVGGGQAEVDATIARNILHEDLGHFDGQLTIYHLDDATRDRLIAHSRQDAALAVLNVGTLTKEVRGLRRLILAVVMLLVILFAVELARYFA